MQNENPHEGNPPPPHPEIPVPPPLDGRIQSVAEGPGPELPARGVPVGGARGLLARRGVSGQLHVLGAPEVDFAQLAPTGNLQWRREARPPVVGMADGVPDLNQGALDLLDGVELPGAPSAGAGPAAPFGHMDLVRPARLDEASAERAGSQSPHVPRAPGRPVAGGSGASRPEVPPLDFAGLWQAPGAGVAGGAAPVMPAGLPEPGAASPATPTRGGMHYLDILSRAHTAASANLDGLPTDGAASSSRSATAASGDSGSGRAPHSVRTSDSGDTRAVSPAPSGASDASR